jgi:hypothetical protein
MASNSNLAVMRLEGGNGNGENNDSERTSRLDGTWGVKAKTRVSSTATTRSMDTPRTGRPALGTQIKPRPHNTGEANSGASHSDQLVACWDLPLELVSD